MTIEKQSVLSNITMLAEKLNRTLDLDYLFSNKCSLEETRDLQDNLIEAYNRKLSK
jgi:phosphoserine phosphatase